MGAYRGLYRRGPFRWRGERAVLDNNGDATPAWPALHIAPGAEPTITAAEGDIYWDDTANAPKFYNGSAWVTVADLAGASSFTDVTVTDDLVVGDDLTLSSNGAIITIGSTNTVSITQSANTLTLGSGDSLVADIVAAGVRTYTTATTLQASDSGARCIFVSTTGFTFTLPAAAAGLTFRFSVEGTCASGVHRVACASGDFFRGPLRQSTDGTYVTAEHVANGSTHLAWEGNGSTTSGIAGDWFDVVALDSTIWAVTAGFTRATGSEATFWKTS